MKKGIIGFLALVVCMCALTGIAAGAQASADALTDEEAQTLLALQFDDYKHMTIAEFQNKVWTMTDTPEYSGLLNRLSKDEGLYALRDSDASAAFLYYVLEPLTGEQWKAHTYSGATASNFPAGEGNATLEYDYTLTILAADKIMVKDYCDMRANVEETMKSMLLGRMQEELQSKEYMLAKIDSFLNEFIPYLQTPELAVAIEYAYFPLPAEAKGGQSGESDADGKREQRATPNGTEEDYRSLLALKTQELCDMPLADFNAALLAWANENFERMDRIDDDVRFDDFKVQLSADERSFVTFTVSLSGMENAKYVQSDYTGEPAGDPWRDQYLPMRYGASGGRAGWCALYYQFAWRVSDQEAVTVGERDRQISGMMKAARDFWNAADLDELLKMSEAEIAAALRTIAAMNSTDELSIAIYEDTIQFEHMDERGLSR